MNEVEHCGWLCTHGLQVTLWFFTIVALLGSYFNATMRCKLSYVLWLGSNVFFLWHNFRVGEVQQGVLFAFYLYTAILGIKNTYHQEGWLKRGSL